MGCKKADRFYCFNMRDVMHPYSRRVAQVFRGKDELLRYNNSILDLQDGVVETLSSSAVDSLHDSKIKVMNIMKHGRRKGYNRVYYSTTRLSGFDFNIGNIKFRHAVAGSSNEFSFNLGDKYYKDSGYLLLIHYGEEYILTYRYDNIDKPDIELCTSQSWDENLIHRRTDVVDFQFFMLHEDVIELYLVLGSDTIEYRRLAVFSFNIKTYEIVHAYIYNTDCRSDYIDKSVHGRVSKFMLM